MKQIKISVILFLFLLMFGSLPLTSLAGESHLIDEAGYLTEDEVATLSAQLDEVSDRLNVDVVIVTVNALEGKTATAYADDYYDYFFFFFFFFDRVLQILKKKKKKIKKNK